MVGEWVGARVVTRLCSAARSVGSGRLRPEGASAQSLAAGGRRPPYDWCVAQSGEVCDEKSVLCIETSETERMREGLSCLEERSRGGSSLRRRVATRRRRHDRVKSNSD